jgi:hypothetical protein
MKLEKEEEQDDLSGEAGENEQWEQRKKEVRKG